MPVIQIKCDEKYKAKVKDKAKEKGMSVAEFIRYLIALDEREEQKYRTPINQM